MSRDTVAQEVKAVSDSVVGEEYQRAMRHSNVTSFGACGIDYAGGEMCLVTQAIVLHTLSRKDQT